MTKTHANSSETQGKSASMYPQLPNSSPGRNSVRNMCRVGCLYWTWQQWLKAFLILIYIIFLIVVLPWIIVNIVKDGFSQKWQLISIGGLFVIVSIPLCVWHILQHMLHFTKPILQRPIIRILWMVPIYAVNAWLGLVFPEQSFYMDSLRECYEAYVIYNFMSYILNFLNLEMDLQATLEYKPTVHHIFPLCCLSPWTMGREFIHNCKHGVLQYVVIRPILTFISIIAEWNGVYGDGSFTLDTAFVYVVIVNNISQSVAMYCLILFYKANRVELNPMRPVPKFFCIKAVIFFTFVQSVVIDFLVYYKFINNIFGSTDTDEAYLSIKLQDFIICIEMLIAAIAHKYSFPHQPYHINVPDYRNSTTWFNSLTAMWDMADVRQDVTEHFGVVGSTLSRRFRGRSSYNLSRGTLETDRLMASRLHEQNQQYQNVYNPSTSDSDVSITTQNKNRYGAMSSSDEPMAYNDDSVPVHNKYDGINIVKQSHQTKDYSPQYGVPKVLGNYFVQQTHVQSATASTSRNDPSSRSDNTATKSESGFDLLAFDNYDDEHSRTNHMKKSDSTASDWLSTPTDDFVDIDIRGIDKNRSHFQRDPKL